MQSFPYFPPFRNIPPNAILPHSFLIPTQTHCKLRKCCWHFFAQHFRRVHCLCTLLLRSFACLWISYFSLLDGANTGQLPASFGVEKVFAHFGGFGGADGHLLPCGRRGNCLPRVSLQSRPSRGVTVNSIFGLSVKSLFGGVESLGLDGGGGVVFLGRRLRKGASRVAGAVQCSVGHNCTAAHRKRYHVHLEVFQRSLRIFGDFRGGCELRVDFLVAQRRVYGCGLSVPLGRFFLLQSLIAFDALRSLSS